MYRACRNVIFGGASNGRWVSDQNHFLWVTQRGRGPLLWSHFSLYRRLEINPLGAGDAI